MGRWPATWPRSCHFIGIGGVAMSGLAVLLARRGVAVRGSDRGLYPPASDLLASAGIDVATPFDARHLDPAPDLVVVGNAISPGNVELDRALDDGLPIASLPEVVERLLVAGRRVTAVAGTHGKTTTASLVAFLHHSAGRDSSFLVGGQPLDFDAGAHLGSADDLILEADEYDSAFFDKGPKFLHTWPRIGVLGAVEFDHADIYDDVEQVERAFTWFARLVAPSGALVVACDDPRAVRIAGAARAEVIGVSTRPERAAGAARYWIEGREECAGGQRFEVYSASAGRLGTARLALRGEHNARNALAAVAAAVASGLPAPDVVAALERFRGVRRRLEVVARGDDVVVYSDFAHHPTSVRHTLEAMRAEVPAGGRLIAALEPRSNTMVRDLVRADLEQALARADAVFVAPIDRPERMSPEQRLDVSGLVASLRGRGVDAAGPIEPERILERLLADARPGDRIVLMSNGAFGGLPGRLAAHLAGVE